MRWRNVALAHNFPVKTFLFLHEPQASCGLPLPCFVCRTFFAPGGKKIAAFFGKSHIFGIYSNVLMKTTFGGTPGAAAGGAPLLRLVVRCRTTHDETGTYLTPCYS